MKIVSDEAIRMPPEGLAAYRKIEIEKDSSDLLGKHRELGSDLSYEAPESNVGCSCCESRSKHEEDPESMDEGADETMSFRRDEGKSRLVMAHVDAMYRFSARPPPVGC